MTVVQASMAWPFGVPLAVEPYRVAYRGHPHAAQIYDERFRMYHYLDLPLPRSANAWVVFDVAYNLAAFGSSRTYGKRGAVRECRLVVHPDHRGLGIGRALSTWVAEYHLSLGHSFYSVTQNSTIGAARDRSDAWQATRWNGLKRPTTHQHSVGYVTDKVLYSHQYVGSAGSDGPA